MNAAEFEMRAWRACRSSDGRFYTSWDDGEEYERKAMSVWISKGA